MAATAREDHATLLRGLMEFPLEVARNARSLLSNDSLFRSEKCIGVARWLCDLHEQRRAARNVRVREALTWLAVASAPPGFCHIRTTMIGSLLEDLVAELPFAQVKARFDAKMHPLQYQRPTAAPSAGNIAQAEKVIAMLRAAGSLERRVARLADLKPVWTARSTSRDPAPEKGVFSHLKPKGKGKASASVAAPAVTMTWEKLARTVLRRTKLERQPRRWWRDRTQPRRTSANKTRTGRSAGLACIVSWKACARSQDETRK